MLNYNELSQQCKPDHAAVDDGADLAVLIIASRFNLAPHVARLVVHHAGLGGSENRTTAGKTA